MWQYLGALGVLLSVLTLVYFLFSRRKGNGKGKSPAELPPGSIILTPNEYFTVDASATNCSAACGHGLGVFASKDIPKDSFFAIDKRLLSKLNDATVPLPLCAPINTIQEYVNTFQSPWNNYLYVSHHQRNCDIYLLRDGRMILHTLRTILAREELLRTMDYEWLLIWHRQELKKTYESYKVGDVDMKGAFNQLSSVFNQAIVHMLLGFNKTEKDSKIIAFYDQNIHDYGLKVEQDVENDEDFIQLFMMYIG